MVQNINLQPKIYLKVTHPLKIVDSSHGLSAIAELLVNFWPVTSVSICCQINQNKISATENYNKHRVNNNTITKGFDT